jgi:hypothetical protein
LLRFVGTPRFDLEVALVCLKTGKGYTVHRDESKLKERLRWVGNSVVIMASVKTTLVVTTRMVVWSGLPSLGSLFMWLFLTSDVF